MTQGLAREVVLVNGIRAAPVSPMDRGIHFGDGVFETIACRGGRPRFLSLHLERLALGCSRLNIHFPEVAETRAEVEALAREVDRAIVKLLVTRGPAVSRGYAVEGTRRATRITIRYAWPQEDSAAPQDGVAVRTLALRLGENPALAGLKHCNRLEQILARQECSDAAVAEGILFSSSGKLVSGTLSNVFIVRESILRTPRIDLCGVAGVMRRVVMREAVRAGIATQECVLGAEDLDTADEIFLTNARIGVRPVRELDKHVLAPGPITRRLQAILEPLLEEPRDA
ncbi:MAG: aminodeoxychorismate lyase [Steroidobacteraceae bacterium]